MSAPPILPTPADFAERTALVTGGSDGLGEQFVRELVALDCETWFCGRRRELGEALAAELGPRAHFVACDLADEAQIAGLLGALGASAGRLDFLINNAASDRRIAFEQATAADFDQLVAVNLRAYFLVTQAALPWLRQGQGRAIVNVGTTNYLFGNPAMTVYGAAKAGIFGFTRSLARELGPERIRVNLVSPGWIMTRRQLAEHVSAADQEHLLSAQCVPELMTPAHVAPVVLFLLSDAARAMSGQNLVVDGGYWLY